MLLFSCDHIIIIVTQENGVVMANKDKKFILRKDMGNGVFYVYERTYTYDPKSKNNKTKDRLLYKEVNGVRQETRRRRTREEILEAERLSGISAERKRTGSKVE